MNKKDIDQIFTVDGTTSDDGSEVIINQKLSRTIRKFDSQNLKKIKVHSVLGEVWLHLEKLRTSQESVTIELDSVMGRLNIYVPHTWQVDNQLHATLTNVNLVGKSMLTKTKLVLKGKSSLGTIQIYLI